MQKKFQVFISSTYTDLIEERQQAVKAVLDANHIPAGMELFKANNEDQMKIIKEWIDQSDVFMLILGGRYGSLDSHSQKSYTHLEYEYALEKKMPIFTLVLTEEMIKENFSKSNGIPSDFYESENLDKYSNFHKQVRTNSVVKFISNIYQIDGNVMGSLRDFERNSDIEGWVRTNDLSHVSQADSHRIESLVKEVAKLKSVNRALTLMKVVNPKRNFDFSGFSTLVLPFLEETLSAATNTLVNVKKIQGLTTLKENYVDMVELLQEPVIKTEIEVGLPIPSLLVDRLNTFIESSVLPFLKDYELVIPDQSEGITIYRLSPRGLEFFKLINS